MGSELLTIAIGNNLSTTCSTLTVIYLGFDQLNCPNCNSFARTQCDHVL